MADKNNNSLKPKLLLKTTSHPNITTSVYFSSPIATGSFYLPIQTTQKKNNRKGGRHPPKHLLRKPPSFDTYLSNNETNTSAPYGYHLTRSPSLSSSYSSTSSLVDNEEDVMCGYTQKSAGLPQSRSRRNSSIFKVRFAETDDVSSIVSSSSSVDDWDDEIEEEDEEYIFVSRPTHYGYKTGST